MTFKYLTLPQVYPGFNESKTIFVCRNKALQLFVMVRAIKYRSVMDRQDCQLHLIPDTLVVIPHPFLPLKTALWILDD